MAAFPAELSDESPSPQSFHTSVADPDVCSTTARTLAVLGLLIGASIIAGWMFDITALKSAIPGLRAAQPLSAVCMMMCALALGASTSNHHWARIASGACACAVIFVAAAILIQNALDTDWGIDRLLFSSTIVDGQTGPYLRAGRPAGGAVVGFCLLGLCLLMVSARHRLARRAYVALSTAGMTGAASLLLAYIFSLKSLYVIGLYAQVGVNNAIAFGLLFAGVMVRRADLGAMKHLCGHSPGAVSTRRLLFWTLCVLVVVGGVVQFGTHASWYRAELEIALVALAGVGVLFAGVLSHARRIDELDNDRRHIADKLHGSEARELHIMNALAESLRRKHEFLDSLAHELRNPLAPLRNGIHILRHQAEDEAALKPTVDMMDRQLRELTRAIDELIEKYDRDPPK